MEHLTKHQLVLLSVLASFVTSIATGVVMLSLMNWNPTPAAPGTIERVIEDTVGQALPSGTASVSDAVSPESDLAGAVATVSKSIVLLRDSASSTVRGFGIVVNARGTVMADKAVISNLINPQATYPGGVTYPLAIVESQIGGTIVFLDPLGKNNLLVGTSTAFVPAVLTGSPKLGDTVASLGGMTGGVLGLGIIEEINADSSSSNPGVISTSISPSKVLAGSPLFTLTGAIIGMQSSSAASSTGGQFYPISLIRSAIPL